MNYSSRLYRVYHWFAKIPSKIRWSNKTALTEYDRVVIAQKLAADYYIILTGSNSHLSSILVRLMTLIKTGKWTNFSHALMNCDNITNPIQRDGYKFVEATARGVAYATFEEVFRCDSVCLLSPKNMKKEEWTAVIDALIKCVGKPYDDLFNLADSTKQSCVEVVLDALKVANYTVEFTTLDQMIKDEGNLVPQMYRDCPDFAVELEIVTPMSIKLTYRTPTNF